MSTWVPEDDLGDWTPEEIAAKDPGGPRRILTAEHDRYADLLAEARDYLDHQSWRCAHPPHYYLADGPPENDCACGLDSFMRRLHEALDAADERRKEPPR